MYVPPFCRYYKYTLVATISQEDIQVYYQNLTSPAYRNLDDVMRHGDESFSEMLLRLIDESGRTDADVYRRANLNRRLFSKIHSNPKDQPSKNTALALVISLELNPDQTDDLLRRAGFALSPCSRFNLIVEYFIREGNYNIFEINEALLHLRKARWEHDLL